MKKSLLYVGAFVLALLPSYVHAQYAFGTLSEGVGSITSIIDLIIGLLVGVAILIIVYGIIKFIASGDDAESRKSGIGFMAYGVLGIFVMLSVWGLVGFLVNSFTFTEPGTEDLPSVPVPAVQ